MEKTSNIIISFIATEHPVEPETTIGEFLPVIFVNKPLFIYYILLKHLFPCTSGCWLREGICSVMKQQSIIYIYTYIFFIDICVSYIHSLYLYFR